MRDIFNHFNSAISRLSISVRVQVPSGKKRSHIFQHLISTISYHFPLRSTDVFCLTVSPQRIVVFVLSALLHQRTQQRLVFHAPVRVSTPPPTDRPKNSHVEKHTLPVYKRQKYTVQPYVVFTTVVPAVGGEVSVLIGAV